MTAERARAWRRRVDELGVTPAVVRSLTEGADDLREPLRPTRECLYSDDPRAAVVRELFCSPEFHARWVEGLLLFSDYLGSDPDAVMGAGQTTAVLYAAARPQRRVGSVLDVGCGAGTLALLLARDADRVVGVDINPRAVERARVNAEANGIGNAEFRCGDLMAPVSGERFDLIVSQPPYYPGERLTFLHGGPRGDELARRIVDSVPEHLEPGGRALLFASWPPDRGPLRVPGLNALELRTAVSEIDGTRQSIVVLEHGEGWYSRVETPPEVWGAARSQRIDSLMRATALSFATDEALGAARLRRPAGVVVGDDGAVRGPRESLVNYTYAPAAMTVREALRRGLLEPE